MNVFYEQLKKNPNSCVELKIHDPLEPHKKQYINCQLCSLANTRNNVVFGTGVVSPKLMIIGLVPSTYDSDLGIPFSDMAGRKVQGLVEYLSRSVNLDNNVYMTNLLLCPGVATEESIVACSGRMQEEIQIINPKNILLLGTEVSDRLLPSCKRLTVQLMKVHKYCSVFLTRNLRELFYKRDEVQEEVKEDLDYMVEQINGEKQTIRKNITTV